MLGIISPSRLYERARGRERELLDFNVPSTAQGHVRTMERDGGSKREREKKGWGVILLLFYCAVLHIKDRVVERDAKYS